MLEERTTDWVRELSNMAHSGNSYFVGSISQALSGKKKRKQKGEARNEELSTLFSGGISCEPVFVPVSIKSKRTSDLVEKEDTPKKKRKLEPSGKDKIVASVDQDESKDDQQNVVNHKRRKSCSDDEEDQQLSHRAIKRKKGVKKNMEDPDRLGRTIFVGNLPITFTRKKLQKLFKTYGGVESVRFRSAALTKPNMSRRIGMIKKEFHKDRNSFNGYVVFKQQESATKALDSNGQEIDGLHLRVDLVESTKQHDHRRSVFIGNLPFDTEEESLRQTFSSCGNIESVRLIRDGVTGAGKGFGFILFENKDAVTFALKMNKTEFKGRCLRVFPSSENPNIETGQIRKLKKGRPVAYSFSGLMAKKDRGKHAKHKPQQSSGQARQKRKLPTPGKEMKISKRHQNAGKKPMNNRQKGDFKNKSRQFKGTKVSDKQTKHKHKDRA